MQIVIQWWRSAICPMCEPVVTSPSLGREFALGLAIAGLVVVLVMSEESDGDKKVLIVAGRGQSASHD